MFTNAPAATVALVERAIAEGRTLSFDYTSEKGTESHRTGVRPTVHHKSAVGYVLKTEISAHEGRWFRTDRMRNVTVC